VTTGARQVEAARAFIRHLAAPAAITIYKTKGLAL
jgi:ABC-type Fe3+ transport system substrate-binding protein